MIEFNTYDKLLAILKDKGLIINDDNQAKLIIKQNSYYNVINAYKDIFIDKTKPTETYIEGTTFDDIFLLWLFDKRLRNVLLECMSRAERTLKSIMAHEFSAKYGIQDYLDINNFSGNHTIMCSQLIRKINNEILDSARHNNSIRHYLNTYRFVPFWVLANIISFGDASKLLQCMKQQDQQIIAKEISNATGKAVFANELISGVKILVLVRNLAAHDQRLYNFTSKVNTSQNHAINAIIKYPKPINGMYSVLASIYSLVNRTYFNSLLKKISTIISDLITRTSVNKNIILSEMKLPKNWTELLSYQS